MDFIERKYTLGEEIFNAVTHGTGALLSIAGMTVLIVFTSIYSDARAVTASVVYGITLILMYTMSTLYHSITHEKAKHVFDILDNNTIFLLIAGTYTPYSLCCVRGTLGWIIFGSVWGACVLGIIFSSLFKGFRKISVTIYISISWAIIITVEALRFSMPVLSFIFLCIGAAFYTGGIVFYNFKNLHYMHSIWHLFVVAGTIFHYFSIFLAIVPIG